jgi:hypothetical protein
MRLDNPNTYFVFYEQFLRAVTGDQEYKFRSGQKQLTAQCSMTVRPESRMVTPLDESFALVVLKNNYFAWLLQAMKEFPNLLTDYEEDKIHDDSVTMAEYILGDYLLDLENGEEEKGFAWNCNIDKEKYDDTKDTYNVMVGNLRMKIRTSEEYKQLLELLAEINAEESYTRDEKSLKQKKRKLIKELKHYTGARKKREKAYRGWSERVFTDMLQLKTDVEEDRQRYKRFNTAFRCVLKRINSNKEEEEQSEEHGNVSRSGGALNGLFDFRSVDCLSE